MVYNKESNRDYSDALKEMFEQLERAREHKDAQNIIQGDGNYSRNKKEK